MSAVKKINALLRVVHLVERCCDAPQLVAQQLVCRSELPRGICLELRGACRRGNGSHRLGRSTKRTKLRARLDEARALELRARKRCGGLPPLVLLRDGAEDSVLQQRDHDISGGDAAKVAADMEQCVSR